VHTDATWRIRLNRPRPAAMRTFCQITLTCTCFANAFPLTFKVCALYNNMIGVGQFKAGYQTSADVASCQRAASAAITIATPSSTSALDWHLTHARASTLPDVTPSNRTRSHEPARSLGLCPSNAPPCNHQKAAGHRRTAQINPGQ